MTVIFSVTLLGAFYSTPYVTYQKIIENREFEINVATVASFFMLLLFLSGLIAIVKLTKVIKIDEERETVVILHPFLFRRRTYSFNEIIGFQWSYLSGKISYKSLKLKATDGRIFQFSDFEISNFRNIERTVADNFELRSGKGWKSSTEMQIQFELEKSKLFDVEQAKEIRLTLWIGIAFSPILLLVLFNRLYRESFNIHIGDMILFAVLFISFYSMVVKLERKNQILDNYKA